MIGIRKPHNETSRAMSAAASAHFARMADHEHETAARQPDARTSAPKPNPKEGIEMELTLKSATLADLDTERPDLVAAVIERKQNEARLLEQFKADVEKRDQGRDPFMGMSTEKMRERIARIPSA